MFFLGIFFLINTVDRSISTAKSGRITKAENSGTVGVGLGEAEVEAEKLGTVMVCTALQSLTLPTISNRRILLLRYYH